MPGQRQLQLTLALAVLLGSADGGQLSFDGTWVLDLGRSGDPTPMLERLDAGFFVRSGARSARPTHVIATTAEGVAIEVKAPLTARRSLLVLDGATPIADDFLGNKVRLLVSWEAGCIVSRGALTLKEKELPLLSRRCLAEDGTMRLTWTLSPPGEPSLSLERVFTRKE